MITTKERATLTGIAGKLTCTMQIGKEAITDEGYAQIEGMLNKNEIAKIRVLNNSSVSAKEIAEQVALKTNADVVQVIGHVFVLFRKSKNPKAKHIIF